MIRLFACDLDGTLLNRTHQTDTYINETVDAVLAQGKEFVIATGRHMHANHQISLSSLMKKPIYKIHMNGAVVLDKGNQVLFKEVIDVAFVLELQSAFPDIPFEFITTEGIFITEKKGKHLLYNLRNGNSPRKWLVSFLAYGKAPYQQIKDLGALEVLKVDCRILNKKRQEALRTYLRDQQASIDFVQAAPEIFEITKTGINKQATLSDLLAHLAIPENQAAVYGNDVNDIEMIDHFEHAFVPADAIAAIKPLGKVLDQSYKDHAVPKHIRSLLNHPLDK